MSQLQLFDRQGPQAKHALDICAARHRGAPTSIEAHERVRSRKAAVRLEVLRFIIKRDYDGATIEEVSSALKLRYTTCSARCAELKADGLIHATYRRRRTSSGATAAVLMATEVVTHG